MSKNNDAVSEAIKSVVKALMVRVLEEDPVIKEEHHAKKPLYAALVPDEIFKGSHFERRFVTPFGNVWEKLTGVVAKEYHKSCIQGHEINGNVAEERLRRIQGVLNNLEKKNKDGGKSPDWDAERSLSDPMISEGFQSARSKELWMKLFGTSVSVPVIEKLVNAIVETGVFVSEKKHESTTIART